MVEVRTPFYTKFGVGFSCDLWICSTLRHNDYYQAFDFYQNITPPSALAQVLPSLDCFFFFIHFRMRQCIQKGNHTTTNCIDIPTPQSVLPLVSMLFILPVFPSGSLLFILPVFPLGSLLFILPVYFLRPASAAVTSVGRLSFFDALGSRALPHPKVVHMVPYVPSVPYSPSVSCTLHIHRWYIWYTVRGTEYRKHRACMEQCMVQMVQR